MFARRQQSDSPVRAAGDPSPGDVSEFRVRGRRMGTRGEASRSPFPGTGSIRSIRNSRTREKRHDFRARRDRRLVPRFRRSKRNCPGAHNVARCNGKRMPLCEPNSPRKRIITAYERSRKNLLGIDFGGKTGPCISLLRVENRLRPGDNSRD